MFRIIKTLFLIWAFAPGLIIAQTIELETKERYLATASFLEGEADKKNLLVLHGFLQTNNFSTVKRLADSLHESGYSVLSPTLSLGMHRRRQSLPCEAIHTHSTQTDTDEIKQWVEWLYNKRGKKVTLIGHSSGSITLLNYLDTYGTKFVERIILISMAPFSDDIGPVEKKHTLQAKDDLQRGHDSLLNFQLSYCDVYPTTSSAFLSYIQWDKKKLSELTMKYSGMINIIIGNNDKRLSKEWRELLLTQGINLSVIEGANHFFDQAHEFDLADTTESLLENAD
jgi:pimeloyl-ACP methyl ester carboxylesterase